MITHKKCSTCEFILPIELFSKRASAKDGYRYSCKACEKINEHIRGLRKMNPNNKT